MLSSPEIPLDQYGVSSLHAFLPDVPPLQKLQDPYYSSWEEAVEDLPAQIEARTIRRIVDSLPVLSTSRLQEDADWRRAYVVLAFITHAYIWGGERPEDILPPAVSRPFLEVSKYLELPPCATYAALNLWNFKISSPELDITDPDNLSVINSFTGTKDEEWFFMISVAIEAKGAELIPLVLNAVYAAITDDSQRVATLLYQFSEGLKELGILLERMYEKCRPPVFFHQLRPFLAGSKNMASAGLPNGVFYDLGGGHGEWHQYSGGSNAQSSLIQMFDIFLGIEHSATGEAKSRGQSKGAVGYIQDMRNYMPGPHRRFLAMLTQTSNVRQYAMSHKFDTEVRDAYNTAVMAVGAFRDKHIQMVSRYIITASRSRPTQESSPRINLATFTAEMQTGRPNDAAATGYSGTGGTDLIPFLKQTRDTTKAAASYTD